MKFAGIARASALATALVVFGMLFAGLAGAKPLTRPLNMNSYGLSVDGTDVYWAQERKRKGGGYETVVYRGSFLNNSKVKLARVAMSSGELLEGLSAGGGYFVTSVSTGAFGTSSAKQHPTSKVVRFNRDGSHRKVLATGKLDNGEHGQFVLKNGVAYLDDCGTRVSAFGVSDSGSVVIGHAVSDRRSKACGRKKDVDHWRYYEQRLDGSQREIISKDARVRSRYKKNDRFTSWSTTSGTSAFSNIQILGDRVLVQSTASNRNFVRDLTTGAFTGPFDFTPGTREKYSEASMSANGAVALTAYEFAKKIGLTTAVGIFPSAANPTVFTKSKSKQVRQLLYCGNHLLSSRLFSRTLEELDPVTLAPIRTIAKLGHFTYIVSQGEFGCDNNYVYGFKFAKDYEVSLLAYPLK